MKKLVYLLLVLLTLGGCDNNDPILASSISLNTDNITLKAGDSINIQVYHLPTYAQKPKYVWESSNSQIIEVTSNGVIRAISPGAATLKVQTSTGAPLFCYANVTVNPIEATKITINRPKISLFLGDTTSLNYSIYPDNATFKNVIWSVADKFIATVENGKIKSITVGKTTINAKLENSSIFATCELTVNPILATNIFLNYYDSTIISGQKDTLTYTIKPDNTTFKDVLWESDNSEVISVNNGIIRTLKPGIANIKVKIKNCDVSSTCKVTVLPIQVTGIELDKPSLEMKIGEKYILNSVINPSNASNKSIIWSSSNSLVAEVINGTVTAISTGDATITAMTEDGSFKAYCKIKVYKIPVTSVTLNNSKTSLETGKNIQLTAIVLPSDATNKNLTWTTSDPSVASVSNGLVTALKPGNTIIKVTSIDGVFTANCSLTVTPIKITSILITPSYMPFYLGENYQLTALLSPINTSETIRWTSSNTSVVTVNSSGLLTPVAIGTAWVYASNTDHSISSKCSIEIIDVNARMTTTAYWYNSKTEYISYKYYYTGKATSSLTNTLDKSINLTSFEILSNGTVVYTANSSQLVTLGKNQTSTIECNLTRLLTPIVARWKYSLNNVTYTIEKQLY